MSEDTRIAARSKNKFQQKKYKNILMLHIFKDSPFNFIDRDRIFADYYHWVEKTLEILCESKETWIIRIHPNAKRWGENSEKIFNLIYRRVVAKTGKKPNIIFDNKKISNIQIFKTARKIVTFSGTPHIEAVCFGIKPIVISHVTLSVISEKLVLKPKSIKEYKSLILKNKNEKIFKSKKNLGDFAKKILFIVENTLSFQKQLDLRIIYRSDSNKILNRNFDKSLNKLNTKSNYTRNLNKIVDFLDSDLKRTLSWKYLNLLKKNKVNYVKKDIKTN